MLPKTLSRMEAALLARVDAMETEHRTQLFLLQKQIMSLQAENEARNKDLAQAKHQIKEITSVLQALAPLWGISPLSQASQP